MANEPTNTPAVAGDQSAQNPQLYVRTFAKDMAAVSGKPIAPTEATPPPPAPPAPVKKEAPPPEPPPAPLFPKAPSTDETRDEVLTRLKAKVATYTPKESAPPEPAMVPLTPKAPIEVSPKAPSSNDAPPTQPPAPTPEPTPAPKPTPTPPKRAEPADAERIHTYKSDFADHIDANDASTFSVLAAQADAGHVETVRFVDKKPFPIAIVLGVALIVLGVGVVYTAFSLRPAEPVIPQEVVVPSLIFADSYRELSGENDALRTAFLALSNEPLEELQAVVGYLTQATTSLEGVTTFTPQQGGALVTALRLPAPEILLRSLLPESTVGVIRVRQETRPFLILRTDSYERSFAGMLDWEARIIGDLTEFYPPFPQTPVALPTATTTATSSVPVEPRSAFTVMSGFEDAIVEKRDVRVLRDGEGRTIMLYGYYNKETLILARSEEAFIELSRRLASSRAR